MSLEDLAVRAATKALEKELNHQKEKNGRLKTELKAQRSKNQVRPITPDEVVPQKKSSLPSFVIQAFNNLIAKFFSGGRAEFEQNLVIEEIQKLAKEKGVKLKREDIFDLHYLDVEEIFEEAGWRVEYDKPGYNETYAATFTFRK